jgi:hypothetical protein
MSHPLRIDSDDLQLASLSQLADAIGSSSGVVVKFGAGPTKPDLLRLTQVMLLAEASRTSLSFVGWESSKTPESTLAAWYEEALAGHSADSPETAASPSTKSFVSATSRFPLSNRIAFQGYLTRQLAKVGIAVPSSVYGALSTIAFEAAMNAEEHGSVPIDGALRNPRRVLAACLRAKPRDVLPSASSEYIEEYRAHGHSDPQFWLELVVADTGVGIAYPSYRSIATRAGRTDQDLYRATFAEERMRTQILLNSKLSTKGEWGRTINRETASGDGKNLIRLQLSAVRGFVSVTAGRTQSVCWYAKATRTPTDLGELRYEVLDVEQPLLRGTIWHLILPVDQQFSLMSI